MHLQFECGDAANDTEAYRPTTLHGVYVVVECKLLDDGFWQMKLRLRNGHCTLEGKVLVCGNIAVRPGVAFLLTKHLEYYEAR